MAALTIGEVSGYVGYNLGVTVSVGLELRVELCSVCFGSNDETLGIIFNKDDSIPEDRSKFFSLIRFLVVLYSVTESLCCRTALL